MRDQTATIRNENMQPYKEAEDTEGIIKSTSEQRCIIIKWQLI